MKKWFKVYYSILFFPLLYIPYYLINSNFLVEWFGCPCDNPKFNANDVTDIFWMIVGIITVLLFIINYLKIFKLKTKKNIFIFIISSVVLISYAILLTTVFPRSMYWK